MTDWRAQLRASIDTGGIPAPAPDVTKLVVDELSQDLFHLNRRADVSRVFLFVS